MKKRMKIDLVLNQCDFGCYYLLCDDKGDYCNQGGGKVYLDQYGEEELEAFMRGEKFPPCCTLEDVK